MYHQVVWCFIAIPGTDSQTDGHETSPQHVSRYAQAMRMRNALKILLTDLKWTVKVAESQLWGTVHTSACYKLACCYSVLQSCVLSCSIRPRSMLQSRMLVCTNPKRAQSCHFGRNRRRTSIIRRYPAKSCWKSMDDRVLTLPECDRSNHTHSSSCWPQSLHDSFLCI